MHEPYDPNLRTHDVRLPASNGGTKPKRKHKANGHDRGETVYGDLPVIRVVAGEMPRVVDEAERALLEAGVLIFRRGGMLVRPVTETVPAANGRKTKIVRLR